MNISARLSCVAAVVLSVTAHAQEGMLSAPSLARSAYVEAVLQVNPSIAVARETWRAALSRVRQAGGIEDAMLDASIAPLSIAPSSARLGVEVALRQTLPWFGKQALERNMLSLEAAAAASDLESTRRELALMAATLYAQYYAALHAIEINGRYKQLLEVATDTASAQLQSGRGTVQDVLAVEVESAQLERSSLELATERDLIVAQMNQLLHRDPAAALPPAAAVLELPKARDPRQLEAEALRERSEIASAQLQARAQALKADAARRDYYPSITLMTSYSSMWDMPQHRWMLGAGVNLPWPNERRAAAIDEARATQARYESEATRLRAAAQTEVYVALRRLEEAEQLLKLSSDRLLPAARARLDAVQAGLATSQASFASVIEAQRAVRTAELEQKLTEAELMRRSAELERALGRAPGFEAARGER